VPKRSLFQQIGRALVGGLAALFGSVSYVWITAPDVRALATTRPADTAFMRMRREQAIAAGRTPRAVQRWVGYNQISPTLKRAVLVTEDAAFWTHDGLDYAEIRASIEQSWARGRPMRGASTITQQLAKNLYLSPSRNPYRKVSELFIARRLEAELTKARILELYLNLIEWGDGIWGAEAAAETYFGVSAGALSAEQSALLAGAIFNPLELNPGRPNKRLQQRQQMILRRMGEVALPQGPSSMK
jgi:monofunctional biosynthetic peptidoglycan transglycosylase